MKHARTWLAPLARFTMIAASACPLPLTSSARAQGYPNKPVRVVVQYPPGGTPDICGRTMSTEFSKLWKRSFQNYRTGR